MNSNWTKTPPTQEGWYWAFVEASENEVQIVYVFIGLHKPGEISVITFGNNKENDVSIVNLWGEHLQKPKLPMNWKG